MPAGTGDTNVNNNERLLSGKTRDIALRKVLII